MSKRETRQMILPGPEGWLLIPFVDGAAAPPQPLETPRHAAPTVPTNVLLPAVSMAAIPLWLQGDDETLFPEMIRLQLERRGLGAVPEGAVSWKVITRENTRTLVLAVALLLPVADEIAVEQAERFEPSPAARKAQDGHLFLYQELGRIVAAYYREGRLAWFQTLGSTEPGEELEQELQCLVLQLAAENVIDPFAGVLESLAMPEEYRLRLSTLLGVPVHSVKPPDPVLPEAAWNLVPPAVAEYRVRRQTSATRKKILGICAAVYVLFVLFFAAKAALQYQRVAALRKDVQATAPAVTEAKETAQRWRALELAINPSLYPTEQLLQAAKLLPPDGVRFTIVEQRGTIIQIRGEAKNAPAAFKLFEDLKHSSEWQGYTWQMPNPRLLPNGSAQFQIEGTRGYATAQL